MGTIAGIWSRVQRALFVVKEALRPLTEPQRQVVMVLEVVRVEDLVPAGSLQWPRRRRRTGRVAIARARKRSVFTVVSRTTEEGAWCGCEARRKCTRT